MTGIAAFSTLAMLAGCGSSGGDAGAPSQTPSASVPVSESSQTAAGSSEKHRRTEPTARIVWSYFDQRDSLFRFLAQVKNPATRPRAAVVVTWTALDADGAIIGSYPTAQQPTIPAGGSIYYAGGAGGGHLSGAPKRVTVEVSDSGNLINSAPDPTVTVVKTTFEKEDFTPYPRAESYGVSTTLLAHSDVKSADVATTIVLRDKSGKIVGADFALASDLPDEIKAGEKFRMTEDVPVPRGSNKPTTVEAWAHD